MPPTIRHLVIGLLVVQVVVAASAGIASQKAPRHVDEITKQSPQLSPRSHRSADDPRRRRDITSWGGYALLFDDSDSSPPGGTFFCSEGSSKVRGKFYCPTGTSCHDSPEENALPVCCPSKGEPQLPCLGQYLGLPRYLLTWVPSVNNLPSIS